MSGAEITRHVGRLELTLGLERPSWQFDVGLRAWHDGVTAGVDLSLFWLTGYAVWWWNHGNCPVCFPGRQDALKGLDP